MVSEHPMSKRVLIVSWHFYPDTAIGARRISELAISLAGRGCTVTALTGRSRSPETSDALKTRLGDMVQIPVNEPVKPLDIVLHWLLGAIRSRRPNTGSGTASDTVAPRTDPYPDAPPHEPLTARLKRYFHSTDALFDSNKGWIVLACLRLIVLRPGRRFDLVISSGPPMLVHLVANVARRLFRARWVVDLRDPWGDNQGISAETRSGFRTWAERRAERRCLQAADRVVCASPGIARQVENHYPHLGQRISVIMNGYDGPGPDPDDPSPTGHLRILFAGMLYFNRNPFPFLEAMDAFLQQPEVERDKVSLHMVGACDRWQQIDVGAWVVSRGLDDCVHIEPPVDSVVIRKRMAEANVLLNFAQGQPNQIPGKTFDYFATGRETLLVSEPDSDSSTVVRKSGLGRVVPPDDPEAIRNTLTALYRHYVQERRGFTPSSETVAPYNRSFQNDLFAALIDGLA